MPRARSPAGPLLRLLDGVASPVYALDDDRRIVYCNAACASWLGITALELFGKQAHFHSSPEVTGIAAVAAGLCPPLEAFAGTRLRGSVSHADEPSVRHAEFFPLKDPVGGIGLVLVIVDTSDAAPPSIDQEASGVLLHEAVRRFRQSQAAQFRIDRLIGSSPQIVRAREQALLAARSSASVLLIGPPGSGKQLLARAIHYRGGEPHGPLVPLACSVLSAEMLVSTLAAIVAEHPPRSHDGDRSGTLLLSDLDRLPPAAGAEFSRLLCGGRTSLRLITTSSRPLNTQICDGALPSELACTLSTITIELPPLSQRLADLPQLAQLLLEEINVPGAKQVSSVSPEALDQLAGYAWPGNLDELAEMLGEAHARTSSVEITPRDLPDRIRLAAEATPRMRRAEEAVDLIAFLASVERELIERALVRAKGNKTRAAMLLGMTRPRFYRRLVQLGIVKEPQ